MPGNAAHRRGDRMRSSRLPKYQQRGARQGAGHSQASEPRARGVFMGFDFHIVARWSEADRDQHQCRRRVPEHRGTRRRRSPAAMRPTECFSHAADARAARRRTCRDVPERMAAGARRAAAADHCNRRSRTRRRNFSIRSSCWPEEPFESRGIGTDIVDPDDLEIRGEQLQARGVPDRSRIQPPHGFLFRGPRIRCLRTAYQRDLAVITPHPRAHALYANKGNLALMGDAGGSCVRWALPGSSRESWRAAYPRRARSQAGAELWWRGRKEWFFKPRQGFGSRGAYRGEKLTRRVFAEVMQGEYLAQRTDAAERTLAFLDSRERNIQGRHPLLCLRGSHSVDGRAPLPGPDD